MQRAHLLRLVLPFQLLICSIGFAQTFDKGLEAAQRGDFATALSEWQPIAQAGDPRAQHALGVMCSKGEGVPQDFEQARKWYELAAGQGYPMAQTNLGLLYDEGRGGPQNYDKAVLLYFSAAKSGEVEALFQLGHHSMTGRGMPKDEAKGNQFLLMAAEQGDDRALSNLGVSYEKGRGVKRNLVEAYKWFWIAQTRSQSARAQRMIIENLTFVSTQLSPEERAEGESLAKSWIESMHSR